MTSPTRLIDAAVMGSRVRDYGLNTLSPVVTMVMSGVYATSALALADILRTPDERWVRLSLWFYLMLASVFAMTRQLQFNLMVAHPVSYLLPLQLMFGFVSAAGFGCLPLSTGGPDGWRYAITLLLFGIPMVVIVPTSLLRRVKLNQFSPDLHDVIQHRLRDIRATFRGLPVSSAITLAVAIFAWATRDMDAAWIWVIVAWNVAVGTRVFVLILAETSSFGRFVAAVEQARAAESGPAAG